MAYADLLINWCSVYEFTEGAADGYGTPAKTWTPVAGLGDIACRIMPVTGVELKVGAEVVIAEYQLFLGDVTITEQNKVYVYWGTVDAWVEYEILLVKDRQNGTDSHHKELLLRTVR